MSDMAHFLLLLYKNYRKIKIALSLMKNCIKWKIQLDCFPLFTLQTHFILNLCSNFILSFKSSLVHRSNWTEITLWFFFFFYFLLYIKKKVLKSRKFSTSCFWWIYMLWEVLNEVSLFLEDVCPSNKKL